MIRSIYVSANGTVTTDLTQDAWKTALADPDGMLWVDTVGDADEAEAFLNDVFNFHPLAIDDALRQRHVPKVDDWDEYIYAVVAAMELAGDDIDLQNRELDLFLGRNYLVTLRELPISTVDRVWDICSKAGRPLQKGPDHLMYLILDAVTAGYMSIVDKLDEEIDKAEDEVFNNPNTSTLNRFFKLKRALLDMRRLLTPTREVLNRLARDDYRQIDPNDRIYFRDVYDHLVRLVDINESLRDLVSGAMDAYLSVISNRLNEIMKTLTVVTLMFMPLTFITGFFGMNFFGGTYEIRLHQGSLGLMLLALVSMVITPLALWGWIKRKGWD